MESLKTHPWDETTNAHVFEYWLEPAKMVQEGNSESGWDFIEEEHEEHEGEEEHEEEGRIQSTCWI